MFTLVGHSPESTVAGERLRAIEGRIRDIEARIATGERVSRPSDDPPGALRIAHLSRLQARLDIEQRSLDRAASRLGAAEVAMAEGDRLLVRARELALMGATDTLSETDRALIAIEVEGLRAQLLDVANRRDSFGRHLFAGARDGAPAYGPDAEGRIVWQGLGEGPGAEAAGVERAMVPPGPRLFGPDGDGAFAALDSLLEALSAPDEARGAAMAQVLSQVDAAHGRLVGARALTGTMLARLEQEGERVAATRLEVARALADANGVDLTAAFAELSALRLTLAAAQKVFAGTAGESLFDRLG